LVVKIDLADDLPLNVSRETLQSNRFMKTLKRVILKHIIQLFTKISGGENTDLIQKVQEMYGSALKLGAIEDTKNRGKLAALASFSTNHRNSTTFDHVSDLCSSSFLVLSDFPSISSERERARNRYRSRRRSK
jgi:HSP90 family molecular chaperone